MITSKTGYVQVPGGKVWYSIAGIEHKNAVPLLALHGGPGYPSYYMRSLEGLADKRPVVVYDQLGCGQSDWPDNTDLWTIERFVQEIAIVRQELGLSKVHLLGHSWGTMLALDYALTKASGIESLILASPCLSVPRWYEDAAANRLKLPEKIQEIFRRHELNGTTDSSEYQEADTIYSENFFCRLKPYPEALIQTDAKFNKKIYDYIWGPVESSMLGGTLNDYDKTEYLKEINIPTLFTCGRYDTASPDTVHWYHSLLPKSEFKIFEHSAHFPHLEEPIHYLETIQEFLRHI